MSQKEKQAAEEVPAQGQQLPFDEVAAVETVAIVEEGGAETALSISPADIPVTETPLSDIFDMLERTEQAIKEGTVKTFQVIPEYWSPGVGESRVAFFQQIAPITVGSGKDAKEMDAAFFIGKSNKFLCAGKQLVDSMRSVPAGSTVRIACTGTKKVASGGTMNVFSVEMIALPANIV